MRKSILVLGLACCPLFGFVACGGSSGTNGDGGSDSDGGGGGDGSSNTDSGMPTGKYTASFIASSTKYMGQMFSVNQRTESGSLWLTQGGGGLPANCTSTTDGACTAADCSLEGGAQQDAGALQLLSGGTVTMTGGTMPVTLTRLMGGSYFESGMMTIWSGGEMLDMKTTGDMAGVATPLDITVQAPHQVTVTQPMIVNLQTPITINRSMPLDVKWTGGMAGNAQVSLTAIGGGRSVSILCTYPANAGTGTVGTAVLGKLPMSNGGPGTGGNIFSVNVANRTYKLIGDVGTGFTATINGITPTGGNAVATMQVQ